MSSFIQMLILAIFALLGITSMERNKSKRLKQQVKQAEDTIKQTNKKMESLDAIQKEIKAIETEEAPKKIKPPESGDVASRLDRLNKLHQHPDSNST